MSATVVFTIRYTVEVEDINMVEVLDKLREVGSAEVVSVEVVE